ncbi:MAG: glycogen/starch/alpha-glucan family phosphorylase, partial [Sinobacteraceae bacterium]|nr:glycogen/starch/alpha-glucan family phosphorylase [Nevskiaceae bacterium]
MSTAADVTLTEDAVELSHSAAYDRHLLFDRAADPGSASARDRFEAFARSVRDALAERWALTTRAYERHNPKMVYYLSMEFLIGRSLANNVTNLALDQSAQRAISEKELDWLALLEQEPDPGLGNGGLGRLAACFLDSMATLQLPAMGYGLRYEYGMFRQSIRDGWQREDPDNWLRRPDPWEIMRPEERVEVPFGCSFVTHNGNLELLSGRPSTLHGIPFDRPVAGYGGNTINTLRLWGAVAPDTFDFQQFSAGEFVTALTESLVAESLTRVLYPDDSTIYGRGLRLVQEYFLVACSLADLTRRFRRSNPDWHRMPDKVAIQLNDTHPSLAVAELMRILLDVEHLGWDEAWKVTQQTLAYTNHTLLPEALEQWPLEMFRLLLPRQLEIIFEINRRFLDEVRARFPGDEPRVARMSLIDESGVKHVRMAHLAIVGSHSTNGVAEIHTRLLRTHTVRDFAEMFPTRFNNKTNGVTPRRWLRLANPALSRTLLQAIGTEWITNLEELRRLRPLAADRDFRRRVLDAKREAKAQFASWLAASSGVRIDPDTIFDCQIKRIH